jgi:hypothetical protein
MSSNEEECECCKMKKEAEKEFKKIPKDQEKEGC